MKLTLINRHPTLRPPLKRWREQILRVIRQMKSDVARYGEWRMVEFNVVLVNDLEIARVNVEFLKHQGPTDVITFDYGQGYAEVLISLDTAKREGVRHGLSLGSECLLYVAHGLLHLAGWDDHRPRDRKQMRDEEKILLNSAGFHYR